MGYQDRVLEERSNLYEKLVALEKFINADSGIFADLRFDEQRRLIRQSLIMKLYMDVLDERVHNFK